MELTIDDLAERCEKCDGTGQEKEIAQKATGGGFGQNLVAVYQIDNFCQSCSGSGRTKLTKTGQAIKELMKALEKNPLLHA